MCTDVLPCELRAEVAAAKGVNQDLRSEEAVQLQLTGDASDGDNYKKNEILKCMPWNKMNRFDWSF
jgi:hypothetical protein